MKTFRPFEKGESLLQEIRDLLNDEECRVSITSEDENDTPTETFMPDQDRVRPFDPNNKSLADFEPQHWPTRTDILQTIENIVTNGLS